MLRSGKDVIKGIQNLQEENSALQKQVEQFRREKAASVKKELINSISNEDSFRKLISKVDIDHADTLKTIAFELKQQFPDLLLVLANETNGKPMLTVGLGDKLVSTGWNATSIIKKLSGFIQGGGGGQPFFATAGGKNLAGIDEALKAAQEINSPL